MNNYEIINKTDYKIDTKSLRLVLDNALKEENVNNAYFNVIFINNDEIHSINKEYRNIDRETDVISFAFLDNEDREKEYKSGMPVILGDIYISLDKANEQAKEYGHSLKRELCFLFVHGLLHLLGYDHMKKEDEDIMFPLQDKILEGETF